VTTEEQEIINALERSRSRPLTKEAVHLSLEQARHLGEIADNVVSIKRARRERIGIIIALMAAVPASAQTLTCRSTFQGYRVCRGPHGYRSFETQWHGMTIGDDNRGNRWTMWPWRDTTITTVTPRPER
jgi:hypothetical protein